ncbi:LysR family transcriptional regulator [Pokkaliibacter sp. MBI-7]|nr:MULTISPECIES: LysR family transcriptional regulator [Pokkaliibacter]MDH2436115.1 LysR family transcriptional regulator [Pokkaliibacter sp. MBI-7]
MSLPISLEALRVLDAIDRRGSFAGAADDLNKVTSAVSYTIQKLEQDMDMLLFDRQGHKAKLTPAGQYLLEQGRQLLQTSERIVEEARQLANGWESRLTLAVDSVMPVFPILELVGHFYREEQGHTDIRLQEDVLGGGWDALLNDRADLLVAPLHPEFARGLHQITLGYVNFHYVAAPDHPLTRLQRPADDEDIREYRAIVVADTSRDRAPLSTGLLDRQPTLTVSSFNAKIAALKQGMGSGFLPVKMADPLIEEGVLVQIPVVKEREPVPVSLYWKPKPGGKARDWFVQNLPSHLKLQCKKVGMDL